MSKQFTNKQVYLSSFLCKEPRPRSHTQMTLVFLYFLNFYLSASGSDAEGTMIPSLLSEPRPDHERQKEATMSRNLSKYALIFLLLALSGLIFLLRNIHSVEVRTRCALQLTDTVRMVTLLLLLVVSFLFVSELELSHYFDHLPASEQDPVIPHLSKSA